MAEDPTARAPSSLDAAGPAPTQTQVLIFNTLLMTAALGVLYYVFEYRPVAFAMLRREDGMVEYMSAAAWALASLLWLLMAWRLPAGQGRARLTFVAMALACFLMAGEEISWGHRIFRWQPPEVFLSTNRQTELNVHNLFEMAPVYKAVPWLIAGWCVVAWSLSRTSPRLRILATDWALPVVPLHLWPFFLGATLTFSDLFRGDHEIGELLLPLAVCALATDTWYHRAASSRRMLVAAAPVIAALVVVPALAGLIFLLSPPPMPVDLYDFAATRIEVRQYGQAVRVLEHLAEAAPRERDDTLFLWALALRAMGRPEEAADRARLHVDGALAGSELTLDTLHVASTPGRARELALSLCMLDRRQEAELMLRHAQSMDRARLKAGLEPAEEAMTRASLAATLLVLGIRKARAEMRKVDAMAPNRVHHLARRTFKVTKRYLDITGCDLEARTLGPTAAQRPVRR